MSSKKFPTTPERSAIMSSIRSTDTTPELTLMAALERVGVKFERHCSDVPGRPDFVMRGVRLAVFVDGDFWHGRFMMQDGKTPKSNYGAWRDKLLNNVARDAGTTAELQLSGWVTMRFWETDVQAYSDEIAAGIAEWLKHVQPKVPKSG